MFSSTLARMHRGSKSMSIHHGPGLVGEAVDTAIGIGASEAFGYIHGKYREKAAVSVLGTEIPANLAVGVAGKVAVVVAAMMGKDYKVKGHSALSAVDTVATAGLNSYFFADGVMRGTRSAGRKIYILESGGVAPALNASLKETDVVGEVPTARGGAYLNEEELQGIGRRHR